MREAGYVFEQPNGPNMDRKQVEFEAGMTPDESSLWLELQDAIEAGDVEATMALIGEDRSRLETMTLFGTPLHIAAEHGQLAIVRRLIEAGADLNARGGIGGGTPLHLAASEGHADIVRYLLSRDAAIDVSESTQNPLFAAIQGGHTEIAALLIDAGIDTAVKYTGGSMQGTDALEYARRWGREDIVRLLGGTLDEPRTTESAPSTKDRAAVRGGAAAAAKMLRLTAKESPASVVKRIQEFVDDYAAGTAVNSLGDDAAVALGALWGNAVCEADGWSWIVPRHGEWRSLGVADPERRYLALPFNFFHTLMNEDPTREMPGPLARFNAIIDGHLPASSPGTYMVITS